MLGSGAIACGVARHAGPLGEVLVWARSDRSAEAARERVGDAATVVTDLDAVAGATLVLEAIVEEPEAKGELYARLAPSLGADAILATTTSSLSIADLAARSGRPERFAGIHLFSPVEKMPLVEVAFPDAAADDTRPRVHRLCTELGKTAVEVPDVPGFVVNRLLFPYLFSAVRLLDETGMEPEAVDTCMKLGAAHPMGPLALLDLVGIDVAVAIGDSLGDDVPKRLRALLADGRLGRKTGAGFYEYGRR